MFVTRVTKTNTFGDLSLRKICLKTSIKASLVAGMDYYSRFDARRTILDFASAGGSEAVREGAFYNKRGGTIQRHLDDGEIVILDSNDAIDRALRAEASAFYCSYWRYVQPRELRHPIGRDLIWTMRAKSGGLKFVKAATAAIIEVMFDAGFYKPWVKYSGELGFDLVVPLESIPSDAWAGDFKALDDIQDEITSYIAGSLVERPNFQVLLEGSRVTIREGSNTCLLSELRAGRGLFLVPMSLNPRSGLVSLPIAPEEVENFSVFDASPADASPYEWMPQRDAARKLIRRARSCALDVRMESALAL
jgi:hypothetical protein